MLKKALIGLSLIVLTTSFKVTDYVYVCKSSTSVAYHAKQSCRGLSKCTHEVIKVTKTEATNTYRKRACKICY